MMPLAEKIKLTCAGSLAIAAIIGYYIPLLSETLQWSALGGGLLLALLLFVTTKTASRLRVFSREAYQELQKVMWPSRKETLQTTGIVILFVVIAACFLWLVDFMIYWVVGKVLA
jgi:preprotein translocase subunit SecE